MRKLVPLWLVVALCAVFASQALAAGRTVKVGDDFFVRKGSAPTVTVKKGTKVTWKWTGKDMHDVAVSKGPTKFASSYKIKGTFSKKLTKTGTYTVFCSIHQPDMKMKLKVVR
jgi:plastocyanin